MWGCGGRILYLFLKIKSEKLRGKVQMEKYTNKYGINTHGNVSMSNLNPLTIKKFLLNLIGVFPLYGIRAPFLLNSLRREMSSLPEGFLFTANYMTNFSHQKISGPTFIFKADSVYVVKHPSDWS